MRKLIFSCFSFSISGLPTGSPLVAHVSRAILNVTKDYREMEKLQVNYFPDETKRQDASSTFSSDNSSLSVYTFGGLFIITAVISISSCLIYLVCFLHKYWLALNSIYPEASLLSKLAKCFDRKDSTLFALEQTSQATHVNATSATNARGADAASSPDARDNMLSNAVSSNQGLDNVSKEIYLYILWILGASPMVVLDF